MFKRPNIDNNDALDAGGLTWTMVKPFEELRIDYVGKVVVLDNPHDMADPKKAFANNPFSHPIRHTILFRASKMKVKHYYCQQNRYDY
jgi:hypothetical protein